MTNSFERNVSAWLNNYIRSPGLLFCATTVIHEFHNTYPGTTFFASFLIYLNAMYFNAEAMRYALARNFHE